MTTHSFLLVDTVLLGGSAKVLPADAGQWPGWVLPVYEGKAVIVSPLVIDIGAAMESGQLDMAMTMVNAACPQLHVSLIDTALTPEGLVRHLRRFVCVKLESGQRFTLRYSDCLAVAALADILTPPQWRTMAGPFLRWSVHGRDGRLAALPTADLSLEETAVPLALDQGQAAALDEVLAADGLVYDVGDFFNVMPGDPVSRHRWAGEALRLWRETGGEDESMLVLLAAAAMRTGGKILQDPAVRELLAEPGGSGIRRALQAAVSE